MGILELAGCEKILFVLDVLLCGFNVVHGLLVKRTAPSDSVFFGLMARSAMSEIDHDFMGVINCDVSGKYMALDPLRFVFRGFHVSRNITERFLRINKTCPQNEV